MTTHPPGADLHLGGDAYAAPVLKPLLRPIKDVTPYPGNPRRHDQDGITTSVRDHGLYASVVIQASTGHVIVGNGRLAALTELGAKKIPAVVMDVDDHRAAAIVARDNKTSDDSTNDPGDLLGLLSTLADMDGDLLTLAGYDAGELDALQLIVDPPEPEDPEDHYTRKLGPIHYVPNMETPPPVEELVHREKSDHLLRTISEADVPEDVRAFLTAGAYRHLVFDYARIAEFYAHAAPEVQALMEESALVIVDYQDAIRHGYVRMSDRLQQILDADMATRAELDAAKAGPRES